MHSRCIADGAPRVDIEDAGQREPAAPRHNRGDIGDPLAVRRAGREAAPEQVRRDWLAVLASRCARFALAQTASVQPLRPHEARDALASTADTVEAQDRVEARTAIHPASGDKGRLDLRGQRRVGLRMGAWGAATPGILAADGDRQRLTHDPHRERAAVAGDERILHGWPREKMPSAFFKISRSCVSRSSARFKRRFSSSNSL